MTAEELTDIKKELNLTNNSFADALGVSQATMQRWCKGTYKIPRVAELAISAHYWCAMGLEAFPEEDIL